MHFIYIPLSKAQVHCISLIKVVGIMAMCQQWRQKNPVYQSLICSVYNLYVISNSETVSILGGFS